MKKQLLILITAALILSLCACSRDIIEIDHEPATVDSAAMRGEFDAARAYVESNADLSQMNSTVQNDEKALYQYWNGSGEENDTFTQDIELEGKTVTIGLTTVSDLKDLGFKVDTGTESVEPNTVQGFSITQGDKYCSLAVENNTDTTQQLADLPMIQFSCGAPDDGFLNCAYSDITCGSTLKEVFDAIGMPQSNIIVTTDNSGTRIELNYLSSFIEGERSVFDTLDIDLIFDKDKDTATVTNITLSRSIEKKAEKPTDQ